jgi:hypothetical protein
MKLRRVRYREVSGRHKFLSDIKDPEFKPSFMSIRDVRGEVYRDTAVVTRVYHTKGTARSQEYERTGSFTDYLYF